MKKFLSLVLALVMTMSLVTISAGAKDFADDSDIDYKAAVDVISELGVVDGYSDNSFRPDGLLTRGAAAKIICNLILGPTTASALSASTAPFKDVPTTNVFAGYITYCAQRGIISGYGDGTFRPTGTLTGNAFMKMLLGALGYDASIEGYTGSNWQVNVVKQAIGIGLDDGNDNFVGSKSVTRGEAALYAFNMLQATMVEYDQKSTIIVGGVEITTSSTRDEVANNTSTDGRIDGVSGGDHLMQFAERYFSDLRKTAGDADEFNRPSTTWTLKSRTIGTYANTPDLLYTEEVELGDIYSDLGLSSNLGAARVNFSVNGATEAASGTANDGTTALASAAISRGSSVKIGGNGTATEVFYDDAANTADVIVVETYGGEVTSVRAETSSRDANITVTPLNAARGGNYDTEAFEVDDIVAYTYSNKTGDAGVKSVVLAETVTGELTGYTAGKSVTVDGNTYQFNGAANISATELRGAVDSDVTLTLDQYGYVLDVDTSETSTNYAVVLKYSDADTWNDARAELLFTDGTTARVNLDKNYTKIASGELTEGDIVSYTTNSRDQYVLKVLNDATSQASAATMVTKGNATMNTAIDGITAVNGKTIFLVATDNNGDTVYTAYTGIANVPTVTLSAISTAVGVYADNGTVATVVYINAAKPGSSVTGSTNNVVFVLGDNSGSSYDSVKGEFWTYDAIVNGEITQIETAKAYTAFGMYNTITEDANGIMTLSNTTDITSNVRGTDREANGSITLGGKVLSYADDCEVFYIDSDDNISVSSIGGITKDETDRVWYKVVNNEVTSIVIQERISGAKAISASGGDFDVRTGSFTGLSAAYASTTFTISGSGTPANGDTIVFTPTVSNGATTNSVTLTYDSGAWTPSTATITVTAENGTTTDYAVSFTVSIS